MAAKPAVRESRSRNMRPRSFGVRVRQRIDSAQIIDRLHDHVVGKCEMSNTQINAARILLNKTLPDLKVHEVRSEDERDLKSIPLSKLMDIIEGDSQRIDNVEVIK